MTFITPHTPSHQPPPPNFNATPTSLLHDTKALIQKATDLQNTLVASLTPSTATYTNFVIPLANDENERRTQTRIFRFYASVSPSLELREASNESQRLINEFERESSMREDLFVLVKAVWRSLEQDDGHGADGVQEGKVSEEGKYYVQKWYEGMLKNGMNLPTETRTEVGELKARLEELLLQSRKALNEETGGLWFTPAELDGVPSSTLKSMKVGEGENEGYLWTSFKYPHLRPIMQYATSSATRRKMYIANDNRCPENLERLKEIISLRQRIAKLLRFKNHAELRITEKMAGSTETVVSFLQDMQDKLRDAAKVEVEEVLKLKREDLAAKGKEIGGVEGKYLFHWDWSYYDSLMKQKTYSFDEKKFSEYFPLERTLDSMMRIFEQLFSLVFRQVSKEEYGQWGNDHVMTWHEDVSVFEVHNDASAGGGFLGYLYLDLHPRDKKYNHAGHFNLQPGFTKPDGTRHLPTSALVMNLTSPQPNKPSLLKHTETRSLFHELGHAIHSLVSITQFGCFHGTATSRDFVEIPSIMLENWWWKSSIIQNIGFHYSYLSEECKVQWKSENPDIAEQPPKELSEVMLDSLLRTRFTNGAVLALKQCHMALFDMAIHSNADDIEPVSYWNSSMAKITGISGPEVLGEGDEWGIGCTRFGPVVRSYDVGYYSYPLSKAYSTDLFLTIFDKDPMNKEVGRRYRHEFLEVGGSQPEMKTLEGFLGRRPSCDAWYKELETKTRV